MERSKEPKLLSTPISRAMWRLVASSTPKWIHQLTPALTQRIFSKERTQRCPTTSLRTEVPLTITLSTLSSITTIRARKSRHLDGCAELGSEEELGALIRRSKKIRLSRSTQTKTTRCSSWTWRKKRLVLSYNRILVGLFPQLEKRYQIKNLVLSTRALPLSIQRIEHKVKTLLRRSLKIFLLIKLKMKMYLTLAWSQIESSKGGLLFSR